MNKTVRNVSIISAATVIPAAIGYALYKKNQKVKDEYIEEIIPEQKKSVVIPVHCVNHNTKEFHSLVCPNVKITDTVDHKDAETLINEGYKPCKICNPS